MARLLLLLALLCSSPAFGFKVPAFTPNVVDTTGRLTPGEIQDLNETIAKIRPSGVWAAVLVVHTTQPESIEQAAEETFRHWQLGRAGVDNGLLILVALQDRRVRIEVGYGLEGVIPDVVAGRLIENALVPAFKNERYAHGLQTALERCGEITAQGTGLGLDAALALADPPLWREYLWPSLAWIGFIVVVPIVLRAAAARRMNRKHGWRQVAVPPGSSFLTLFLLVNPGVFFLIAVGAGWAIFTPLIVAFAYLFLYATNKPYIAVLRGQPVGSAGFKLKADRWVLSKRSGSSSSSGSGSSSSSSSSGGGSSGGGGASGSW